MEDHLTGDSFLQKISTLSLQDWTPDVAELVRQRLLGPSWQKSGWRDRSLQSIVINLSPVRHMTEEDYLLCHLAQRYLDFVVQQKIQTSSSTAAANPPTQDASSAPV